jgi:hypothetical protein
MGVFAVPAIQIYNKIRYHTIETGRWNFKGVGGEDLDYDQAVFQVSHF